MPPPSHLITDQKQLKPLEGYRGLAALCVVAHHSSAMFTDYNNVSRGYLSVDLFFILSGFIIARHYEAAIRDHSISFWQFARRRIARMYPIYLACFVFIVFAHLICVKLYHKPAVIQWSDDHLGWIFFWQLILLQAIGGPRLSWVSSAWSSSVELVINGLFFIFHRYRLPHLLVAGIVLESVYFLYASGGLDAFTFTHMLFSNPIMRGMAGFGIGTLLFHWHHRLPPLSIAHLRITEALLALTVAIACYYLGHEPVIDYLFLMVFFPVLLLLGLYRHSACGLIGSLPVFTALGTISYSLYMVQEPLTFLIKTFDIEPILQSGLPHPVGGLAYLLILIIISTLTYRHIEKPCRKLLRGGDSSKKDENVVTGK